MDQYKIVDSWSRSLLRGMTHEACDQMGLPHKSYSNQYVIY